MRTTTTTKKKVIYGLLLVVVAGGVYFFTLNSLLMKTNTTSRHTDILGLSAQSSDYGVVVESLRSEAVQNNTARRVTVRTSVTNTQASVAQISPGLQMSMISDTGQVYAVTADYLPKNVSIGGPLMPGASMTLQVDFMLPIDEQPTTFIFQSDAASPGMRVGL